MSGPAISTAARQPPPDTLTVFRIRAEARAMLWAAGEIPSIHDAVDVLWETAVRDGLVKHLGADVVQALLAAAFRPVRAEEVPE